MVAQSEGRILDQYDQHAALYDAYRITMEDIVRGIVRDLGLEALSITSRLKEKDSLLDKLRRKDGNYLDLEDITDIAGVRITTYFADQVDKSAERIAHEFDVDWQNSTDKREVLDPDRFGYLSWHHIVTLSPNRAALPEYSQFEGLKVEIQTRSILQHGWAEIEHDIGYKTKIAVPRAYRRRLSRLAGLLELADQEFMSIRDGLDEYERNLPERIRRTPRLVEIDKASLSAYVENSAVVQEVDQEIAALAGIPLDPDPSDLKAETREADVAKLRLLQVDTIEELDAQLSQYKQGIVAFAGEYFSGRLQGGAFSPGISIWYLAYFLAGRSGEFETAAALMQINHSFFKGSRDVSVEDSARHILQTYELISDR